MSDHQGTAIALNIKTTVQEHRLEFDEELAEKEYQLTRLEAEYRRFIDGSVKKIERDKIRLKREIAELKRRKESLAHYKEQDIIDINLTKQGGTDG